MRHAINMLLMQIKSQDIRAKNQEKDRKLFIYANVSGYFIKIFRFVEFIHISTYFLDFWFLTLDSHSLVTPPLHNFQVNCRTGYRAHALVIFLFNNKL